MNATLLNDMFHLGLPIVEKIARPLVVYFFLVIGLRLAGKRELAQLNPFDLVVLLTLSNAVQNAIIGDDNSVTGGIISGATLLVMNYIVVRFLFKHEKLDRLVEGDADTLVENGVVMMSRLEKELIPLNELERAAHRQGFSCLSEVQTAILEPGGGISFIAKHPTPETTRHRTLLQRLDRIEKILGRLADQTDRSGRAGS
jgi:uncharacterized membrane protein YcaP (DUF421 family)